MPSRTLSKSDFKLARTCPVKLYFRENRYPDNRESNEYLGLLADGGYMVEALAKARYPNGIQLEYGRDIEQDFARTRELLQRDNIVLFEATLLVGHRLARIDILEKKGNNVRLIEVKSKSFNGAEHAASLAEGGPGAMRGTRSPNRVLADWTEKIEDVAYQTIMLEQVLPGATITPYLAVVDTSRTASIDAVPSLFELVYNEDALQTARYVGTREQLAQIDIIFEADVSREVALVRDDVADIAATFESRLYSPLDVHRADTELGSHCRTCEFRVDGSADANGFRECWGDLADASPHVLDLYSIGKVKAPNGSGLVSWMVAQGRSSLLDIPLDALVKADGTVGPIAERQRRQLEYTRRGEVYVSPVMRAKINALRYPLHFIDFEASQLALPYHAGMRPYGQVTFQWSCHTVTEPGARPVHVGWLNDVDLWPNQSFAESLRAAIGDDGTVLTWSPFERVALDRIVKDLQEFGRHAPELVAWIRDSLPSRMVDLHEWAKADYFHPRMGGRTGIKYVLDAIWSTDAEMRRQFEEWTGLVADPTRDPYASLPPIEIAGVMQNVREGTGAVRAYQEMMYGAQKHDEIVRKRWAALLQQYCHLDTLSMVLILEHWRRSV